jgi:hypothetical protein
MYGVRQAETYTQQRLQLQHFKQLPKEMNNKMHIDMNSRS